MELNITLAGANFRPAEAKDYIKFDLKTGDKMKLVRDATNAYDERAVQIHGFADMEPIFLGFVPKSDNLLLSQALDADPDLEYECLCTGFIGTLQPTFTIIFGEPERDEELDDGLEEGYLNSDDDDDELA